MLIYLTGKKKKNHKNFRESNAIDLRMVYGDLVELLVKCVYLFTRKNIFCQTKKKKNINIKTSMNKHMCLCMRSTDHYIQGQ